MTSPHMGPNRFRIYEPRSKDTHDHDATLIRGPLLNSINRAAAGISGVQKNVGGINSRVNQGMSSIHRQVQSIGNTLLGHMRATQRVQQRTAQQVNQQARQQARSFQIPQGTSWSEARQIVAETREKFGMSMLDNKQMSSNINRFFKHGANINEAKFMQAPKITRKFLELHDKYFENLKAEERAKDIAYGIGPPRSDAQIHRAAFNKFKQDAKKGILPFNAPSAETLHLAGTSAATIKQMQAIYNQPKAEKAKRDADIRNNKSVPYEGPFGRQLDANAPRAIARFIEGMGRAGYSIGGGSGSAFGGLLGMIKKIPGPLKVLTLGLGLLFGAVKVLRGVGENATRILDLSAATGRSTDDIQKTEKAFLSVTGSLGKAREMAQKLFSTTIRLSDSFFDVFTRGEFLRNVAKAQTAGRLPRRLDAKALASGNENQVVGEILKQINAGATLQGLRTMGKYVGIEEDLITKVFRLNEKGGIDQWRKDRQQTATMNEKTLHFFENFNVSLNKAWARIKELFIPALEAAGFLIDTWITPALEKLSNTLGDNKEDIAHKIKGFLLTAAGIALLIAEQFITVLEHIQSITKKFDIKRQLTDPTYWKEALPFIGKEGDTLSDVKGAIKASRKEVDAELEKHNKEGMTVNQEIHGTNAKEIADESVHQFQVATGFGAL